VSSIKILILSQKACVFKSALNLGINDVDELQAALRDAVKNNNAVRENRNQYGHRIGDCRG